MPQPHYSRFSYEERIILSNRLSNGEKPLQDTNKGFRFTIIYRNTKIRITKARRTLVSRTNCWEIKTGWYFTYYLTYYNI